MIDNFEKNIIKRLLDKYEHSKLSKGGSEKNIKISLSLKDKELKSYTAIDSYKYRDRNDAILKELENKGFINVKLDDDGDFQSLTLNIDNVDKLYKYDKRSNPLDMVERVKDVLRGAEGGGYIQEFKKDNLSYINEKYTYKKEYFEDDEQLKLILKALNSIQKLNKDIKIRDFSVNVFGNSKVFESIKNKVAKILKRYDNCLAEEIDDVLSEYHIIKNSTYALIKNNIVFKLNDGIIDLNDIKFEFCLSDEMIESMEIKDISANKIITVENLTSFYNLIDSNALIIYLGGFHNHTKRMLLKKIYSFNPNIDYYHFGDIDAGGFYILDNLINSTSIPFKPYKMGIKELESNFKYCKKLTDNDIQRLTKMNEDERFVIFKDVISYMLKNNIKLEQEILDEI